MAATGHVLLGPQMSCHCCAALPAVSWLPAGTASTDDD
jgi:hypothetical protein